MGHNERIALWLLAIVNVVGLALMGVVLSGELSHIDRQLRPAQPDVEAVQTDDILPTSAPRSTIQLRIAGVQTLTDTVSLTITVRADGRGDLLYEPPMLLDAEGGTYLVVGDSLAQARMAFLDLVTRGQATANLVFGGTPLAGVDLTLVFNPNQEAGSATAPLLRVPVPKGVEK